MELSAMAGTNILVRQKDLIAGSGISITPDTTSGNVTIAATNTAIDEARLLPTGGKNGNILEYQEGADRGNGNDVRLLLQSALTDSASGNAAPAAVTTQGVTLTGDNSLLFSGNDSHVTAVLATDEIFAADKEWTIDFWMKPIANSSEWNYILTENRGDWGSHSIGLTWNKTKNVLEQDTGGYVASVIKAPNWPNNSIACAVGEWHFVAVEKQKTATGWSLNYYLNGAIWLQVAFTGEFVPFTSDNPFWFGGKTTDSGRWFKGEANKLRVTAGARYGGKAFAVPDRLIDYAAPAGQPVWIEGIDRSRLLPENPASGDIPCYNATATTGGGNDENTRLLIQPSNSDHGIVDQAAGNAAPVTLENHNVTVDEEGNMVFDGSNSYLKIPANTLPSDFFNGTDEWTLDIVYNVASKSMQCLFGCSSSLRMDFLLDSNGLLQIGGGPNLGTGWPFNEDVHLTFEIYKDGASWKYTIFRNGSVVTTGTWVNADWRSVAQYVGWEGESDSRKINGKIKALRLTSGALHKGAAFQSDYPWTKPQTVGEWGKFNKSELVVNDARLLPDAPSDTTNSYWLNSGPVATQVSPASYAGSTDATWTMELSGAFEDGDISTLFDSDTTNGVSGTLGLETFGTVRWRRKDQVPYRIDRIVLRAQNSDIGAFPKTIHLSGYDKSAFGPAIVQEFNAPVWETESDTSTYATSFTRVCTLEVNAPAFQSYDYSIVLGSGSGLETTLQAFAAYQLDTETAWKQLNTATTTTAGLMAAADKVKLDALQQAATYINIATDFNTYKTAGSYFLKGAAHTNGPLTDRYAGTLVVVAPAELQYATQYFTQLYTNKTFVRTYSRDNSAWSAWNRVIVDTDLATTTVAGLMAAADKAALTGLTARGIYPNALAKSGAIDFNEVIDHGFYFIGGDTPHLNYPETYQQNGGTLQVIRSGNYLTQTFIPLNINKAFIRSCLNVLSDSSERTFSAWQRMLTGTDQYSQKVVALADFDDYRTPGEYFFYTAAHLNSPDAPNNTAGWLVIEIVSGGEHVKQTYYALNTRKTYIRTYNNRNQVWLPWLQQLSIADITESKARPGYFKLPGGMIVQWGAALNITADGTTSVTLPIAFPNSAFVATATASGSGLIASAAFDGNSKLNVIVKGYPGSGSFTVYWIAIGY